MSTSAILTNFFSHLLDHNHAKCFRLNSVDVEEVEMTIIGEQEWVMEVRSGGKEIFG